MDLLPIEIFEDCIFPFLELKDVGNFKQVCKYFSTLKIINEKKIKEKIITKRVYLKEINDKINFIHESKNVPYYMQTLEMRVGDFLNYIRHDFPEVKGSLNYIKNFRPTLPYYSSTPSPPSSLLLLHSKFKKLVPQLKEDNFFIPLYYSCQKICWYDVTLEDIEEEPFYLFDRNNHQITKIRVVDYLQLYIE